MNTEKFEMVAKTFQGLEEILADELRGIGALNVQPGRRMVAFEGDLATLYKANLCCRTALRILKPIYKFTASDPDALYEMTKEFDWTSVLSIDKTFSIDSVVNSEQFTHSRYVTYRVKDGIVDSFKDRFGADKRPGVRLQDADVMINVHIDGNRVTLSLDSSGESLHKRGYRVAQTEAPINEVLAAGILLKSGWKGECPLVDPMCGSGTFLIEAALIAAKGSKVQKSQKEQRRSRRYPQNHNAADHPDDNGRGLAAAPLSPAVIGGVHVPIRRGHIVLERLGPRRRRSILHSRLLDRRRAVLSRRRAADRAEPVPVLDGIAAFSTKSCHKKDSTSLNIRRILPKLYHILPCLTI